MSSVPWELAVLYYSLLILSLHSQFTLAEIHTLTSSPSAGLFMPSHNVRSHLPLITQSSSMYLRWLNSLPTPNICHRAPLFLWTRSITIRQACQSLGQDHLPEHKYTETQRPQHTNTTPMMPTSSCRASVLGFHWLNNWQCS